MHEAARIHRGPRERGGVAGSGGRAADDHAGDWILSGRSHDESAGDAAAFRDGLNKMGYVEGQNLAIEYRWAEGRNERLPDLAADLVRRQVAVIAAVGGNNSTFAARAATVTIPIVSVDAMLRAAMEHGREIKYENL